MLGLYQQQLQQLWVGNSCILLGDGLFRIGFGYDVHRLVEGRDLIIGGVKIPYSFGLLGHSDADALTHAIESFTSRQSHFISEPISLRAITRISANLRGAVFSGLEYSYREKMMEGSYLAGLGLA